jgi:hypothetical protein
LLPSGITPGKVVGDRIPLAALLVSKAPCCETQKIAKATACLERNAGLLLSFTKLPRLGKAVQAAEEGLAAMSANDSPKSQRW